MTPGSGPESGWRRSCPASAIGPAQLAAVVRAARDAGAAWVWTNLLYLRPGTREHFLENLGRDWPELLPEYERLYAGRAYLPASVGDPVRREVARLRALYERRGASGGPDRPSRRRSHAGRTRGA